MGITTKKQGELTRARIMTFIIEFICEHGYSPSYVEIMEGTGIKSKSTVSYQLLRLRDEGEINFIDYEPRTISVTGLKFVEVEDELVNNITELGYCHTGDIIRYDGETYRVGHTDGRGLGWVNCTNVKTNKIKKIHIDSDVELMKGAEE